MKPKPVYLSLCVLGAVLPYWQFVPWLIGNGLDPALFVRELFANRISAFFGMDVLVSAVALLLFMRLEPRRLRVRNRWIAVIGLLLVGVSLALPLYLYLREMELEAGSGAAAVV